MKLPNGEIAISRMTPGDLKNLVQTGEGRFLEFKRTIPTAEKIAREIAAFANTKGGTILVGVDDNGTIPGIREYFEEEFLLMKAAQDLCVPEAEIKIELVHAGPVDVMVVHVPEAEVKPVYNKNKKKRLVYVRRGDSSVVASDEVTEVLKQQYSSEGVTFEYGKNEQMLFRYLNEYGEITVSNFANLINQTSYRASRILVNLVSAGVLNLFTKNDVDYYTFSNRTKE
ncbi:ATP-binding protein [Rhodohalobacter sp. SW132]|uniref:AlbA family DNA-binding domain-containing protein n=1 Tax=Rhodohalobacter sp. SW132 TaxID=2293433 RepID=UPI000E26BF33|nr:ATP-binding protein [Rhodohalobacter sp. SW132]REL38772.1 ATP-binding protein [Rhodohalobacter sp. SW132]